MLNRIIIMGRLTRDPSYAERRAVLLSRLSLLLSIVISRAKKPARLHVTSLIVSLGAILLSS